MRDLKWIILLLLACVAILMMVSTVSAEDANGSYAIVDTPTYPLHETYRIDQGGDVYVNDTIDIAGMGHGQLEIAWFGKYGEYEDPQYIYKFSLFRSEQENFWLNPEIFASRTGPWYQYYGRR